MFTVFCVCVMMLRVCFEGSNADDENNDVEKTEETTQKTDNEEVEANRRQKNAENIRRGKQRQKCEGTVLRCDYVFIHESANALKRLSGCACMFRC